MSVDWTMAWHLALVLVALWVSVAVGVLLLTRNHDRVDDDVDI
jgi:hypothetical protein